MDGVAANRPAFFKFFLPAFSEKQMEIPTTFSNQIRRELSETVVFRDRCNNLWQVKMKRVDGKLYFHDGWVKFVEDNSIEGGDMLVFEYISQGLFNVTLFGLSGCEKKIIEKYKGIGIEEQEQEEYVDGKEDEIDDEEHVVSSESDDEEYADDDEKEIKKIKGQEEDDDEETKSDDCMYNNDEDDEENDEDRFVNFVGLGNVREQKKSGTNDGSGTSKKRCRRKRLSDIYGVELLLSCDIPIPTNPYFLTHVTKRKGEMYVPKEIVKNNEIKLPKEIIFVDPNGRTYASTYREWTDGRVNYAGGWDSLCKKNTIGINDVCICEFVEEDGKLHINVGILRFD